MMNKNIFSEKISIRVVKKMSFFEDMNCKTIEDYKKELIKYISVTDLYGFNIIFSEKSEPCRSKSELNLILKNDFLNDIVFILCYLNYVQQKYYYTMPKNSNCDLINTINKKQMKLVENIFSLIDKLKEDYRFEELNFDLDKCYNLLAREYIILTNKDDKIKLKSSYKKYEKFLKNKFVNLENYINNENKTFIDYVKEGITNNYKSFDLTILSLLVQDLCLNDYDIYKLLETDNEKFLKFNFADRFVLLNFNFLCETFGSYVIIFNLCQYILPSIDSLRTESSIKFYSNLFQEIGLINNSSNEVLNYNIVRVLFIKTLDVGPYYYNCCFTNIFKDMNEHFIECNEKLINYLVHTFFIKNGTVNFENLFLSFLNDDYKKQELMFKMFLKVLNHDINSTSTNEVLTEINVFINRDIEDKNVIFKNIDIEKLLSSYEELNRKYKQVVIKNLV